MIYLPTSAHVLTTPECCAALLRCAALASPTRPDVHLPPHALCPVPPEEAEEKLSASLMRRYQQAQLQARIKQLQREQQEQEDEGPVSGQMVRQ